MKTLSIKIIVVEAILAAALWVGVYSAAHASQGDFCSGFEMGYKTIKGNGALVPICPLAPIAPLGSSDYQEGIKAGIEAAQG